MLKKGVVFILCSCFVASMLITNSNGLETIDVEKGSVGPHRFMNCYIEVHGYLHNDWPAIVKLPNMLQVGWTGPSQQEVLFGSYSYVLFEEDASLKVYDEKDGTVLYSHEGVIDPLLTLIGFSGFYDFVDPPGELRTITLEGNALFASVHLKDFGQ